MANSVFPAISLGISTAVSSFTSLSVIPKVAAQTELSPHADQTATALSSHKNHPRKVVSTTSATTIAAPAQLAPEFSGGISISVPPPETAVSTGIQAPASQPMRPAETANTPSTGAAQILSPRPDVMPPATRQPNSSSTIVSNAAAANPQPPIPGSASTDAASLPQTIALPAYLSPGPNPLQLPTTPAEVTIQGAQPLTLEQTITLATRNSRPLAQAKLQLGRSRAVLREAQAALYPNIALAGDLSGFRTADGEIAVDRQRVNLERDLNSPDPNVRAQARFSEPAIRQAFQDTDKFRGQGEIGVNLDYDLYTSGRRSGQITAAAHQVRLSELEVERVTAQVQFEVADAYYQLQDAEAQILISEAAVRSAESNLKDTQAQLEAGLGTKFEVLRVQVRLANEKQQLTQAIANREIQRRRLAQRLSLPESVIVVPADAPDQQYGKWPLDLESSIILAYKHRAELEQQLVQREISEARRQVALAALGPTISLVARWNFVEVFEQEVNGSGYLFGAQIRWSLVDGGVARSQAAQQTKEKELAESRFAEQREAIRLEVEQAYATLLANQANISTTRTAIEQAQEALRLAVLRFQAGVGTQTDRLAAESDLTRAQGNYASAFIGYNRALAQLRRAVSHMPSATV